MLYFYVEYRIGVLAMVEEKIVEKLKLDIEERERSYQKELAKIKKEDNLLSYIKGMLDITQNDVSNFPYYDGNNIDEEEALEDFNMLLKYTLKEDKIISSFKSEIKNLYYLEKIGYQHAEQYAETKRKLEEYRIKIEEAYNELIANEILKKATVKKEEILKKLDNLKDHLEEQGEIENIDSFYEELQYANLSENEKTSILLSIFEKNLKKEQQKIEEINRKEHHVEKKVGKIKKENIEKIRMAAKALENSCRIKITFPKTEQLKPTRVEKNRFLFAEI